MTSTATSTASALLLMSVACGGIPTDLSVTDERAISVAAIQAFMKSVPTQEFSTLYVSDEYLEFAVDSAFILDIDVAIRVERGRRSEVWVAYDIVREGGLLIELGRPRAEGGLVKQTLRFSATSAFGGELEYHLRPAALGGWRIVAVATIWMA